MPTVPETSHEFSKSHPEGFLWVGYLLGVGLYHGGIVGTWLLSGHAL
jgi:hypothetical protein